MSALLASTYYALRAEDATGPHLRWARRNPRLPPDLNAVVEEAASVAPVLGYTIPYAMAKVLLTLPGPMTAMTV